MDDIDVLSGVDAEELAEFLLRVNEHLLRSLDYLYDELARFCDHRPEVFDQGFVFAQQVQYAARKRLLELGE